jgi:hypothetical protein
MPDILTRDTVGGMIAVPVTEVTAPVVSVTAAVILIRREVDRGELWPLEGPEVTSIHFDGSFDQAACAKVGYLRSQYE